MSDNPDPALLVVTQRPGRPRGKEPTYSLSTRLPESALDALIREAKGRRVSLSGLTREFVLVCLSSTTSR